MNIVKEMEGNTKQQPLSLLPESTPDKIAEALVLMNAFLCTTTPDSSSITVMQYVMHPLESRRIVSGGYKKFMGTYKKMYEAIFDSKNLYAFPGTLVKRSLGEVETLLGVDLNE